MNTTETIETLEATREDARAARDAARVVAGATDLAVLDAVGHVARAAATTARDAARADLEAATDAYLDASDAVRAA